MNDRPTHSRRNFLATTAGMAFTAGIATNSAADAKSPSRSKTAPVNTAAQLIALSALELSASIKARKVSCAEVMTAYLDHIESCNSRVNAIVSLQDRGRLLDQAAERDAQLAAGTYLGWMHGFPHAVKDLAGSSRPERRVFFGRSSG